MIPVIFITSCLLLFVHSYGQSISSDFLIVGGGTSGCVLASRLCRAFPSQKFILLERGLPRSVNSEFLIRSPRKLYEVWSDRSTTEAYDSLPDAGINGRKTAVLTGTTLGGSSAIAGLQWTMPAPGTVGKFGIKGLGENNANVYYRRAFDTMGFKPPQYPLQYADDYVQAATKAGFISTNEAITPPLKYIWQNRIALDMQSRRNNACSVYVSQVISGVCSKNLEIVQGETASKLLMTKLPGNGSTAAYRISGVETISTANKSTKKQFLARREVILTAGPYGSPKLLQLSGIGSSATLNAAGIAQKINLPVGEQTICRASAGIDSTYTGVPDEPANNLAAVNSPQQRMLWEAGKGGLLATPVAAVNGRTGLDAYFTASTIPFFPGNPELRTSCYHNTESTGFVHIKDNNPFSTPLVNYNLLSNIEDVNRLSSCLKSVIKTHQSFPKEFNMKLKFPPDGVINEGYVRAGANTGAHFVGGCPVGSVLTNDLKVKGTIGLRVIDASSLKSMPISSGPISSVYMLAEYMSDFIANE